VLPEVEEQVNILKSHSAGILEYGNQLIQLYDKNPETFDFKDHAELVKNLHDSTSGARRAGVNIVDLETSALNNDIEQSINNATTIQQSIIIVIILTVTLALSLSFSISSSISGPIRKLRDAAIEIGKGKLGTKIKIQSRDEIGDLANTFNKMSSELKETQEQLLKSERLAAFRVATMVGHDLRNPLQAIENATYYLKNELQHLPPSTPIPQKTMDMLQTINNSVEYADEIVTDLKDFSTTRKPLLEKANINTMIKETLSQVKAPKNVKLITQLEPLPEINVDKSMIKRVFLNLATNGIEAMKNGGTLKTSTKKTKGNVEVNFKDTGTGISKENMKKIFAPFFTTKAKGMGMGLAICKKFVESHGGNIEVESEMGEGTTFTVKLPYPTKDE
jgi:signal transduction histidine kinase